MQKMGVQVHSSIVKHQKHNFSFTLLQYATDLEYMDGFGELSILTRENKRGMDIVAKSDLYVAVIPEQTFIEYFVGYHSEEYNQTLKFLRTFPIFESIGKKQLLKMKYYFIKRHLYRGDHLYQINDETNGIFFIFDG